MKPPIAILDFWPGSHGNFLEYLINCWIFGSPRVENPFTSTGACHGAKNDTQYAEYIAVRSGHYTLRQHAWSKTLELWQTQGLPHKVIRIAIDDLFGRYCLQINAMRRAGDMIIHHGPIEPFDHETRNNPASLRLQIYSKIQDEQLGHPMPKNWSFDHLPSLHISMRSLYSFTELLLTLKAVADFLEKKFVADHELLTVWKKFMSLNQGWNTWMLCDDVLTKVISQIDFPINLDVEQQALLNVLLTETFDIHDGELFDSPDYPNSTSKIGEIVAAHLISKTGADDNKIKHLSRGISVM